MISQILDSHGKDALIASIGLKTSTAGAGIGVLGWLTSQEGMTFVGVNVAVAGFLVNSFFRWREHKLKLKEDARAQIEHELRVLDLRDECGVGDGK